MQESEGSQPKAQICVTSFMNGLLQVCSNFNDYLWCDLLTFHAHCVLLYDCINNCGMVYVSGFVLLKIMLFFLCKTMCQFTCMFASSVIPNCYFYCVFVYVTKLAKNWSAFCQKSLKFFSNCVFNNHSTNIVMHILWSEAIYIIFTICVCVGTFKRVI